MRTVSTAIIVAVVAGALYAIGYVLLGSRAPDGVDWGALSPTVVLVAAIAGVVTAAVESWRGRRPGQPVGWHNLGGILAIGSGLILLGSVLWGGPMLWAHMPAAGWSLSVAIGLGFLASVFLTDRSTALARGILAIGGVVLAVSGLLSGQWVVLVPAILAALAACLIGPAERGTVV